MATVSALMQSLPLVLTLMAVVFLRECCAGRSIADRGFPRGAGDHPARVGYL